MSISDLELVKAFKATLGSESEKAELISILVQAWYLKVVAALADKLNEEEQAEISQLTSENADFDPVSWLLERHPDWETIVLQELGAVMAEFGSQ